MPGLPNGGLAGELSPGCLLAACRAPLLYISNREMERQRERKIEREGVRDCVRQPELFEGLPDGRFVE